jgi:erythromycin esterase
VRTSPRLALHSILGIVLGASLLLSSCVQSGSSSTTDPVTAWLRQRAVHLATVEPGGSDKDLQPFASIIGNARIIGLGEATHGTHEFITMKARLVEYLVTKMGFTTFIMENNWGSSQIVNAYINGGTQPLDDVMRAGLFQSWQTQEYHDMLEWMRAYNANPAHTAKLHFYGMDIQGVSQNDFDAVENYVRAVDPAQLALVRRLYAGIIANSQPYAYVTYPKLSVQTKQQYKEQAQQVYDLLHTHQQAYTHRSSAPAFTLALQTARVIAQFTTYRNTIASGLGASLTNYIKRDAFMAENVSWIYSHSGDGLGGDARVIVWAHDGHIANNVNYFSGSVPPGAHNMGAFLRAQYGTRYLAVGAALFQGSYTAFTSSGTVTETITAPNNFAYNYALNQAGFSPYLIDLRVTPPGAVTNWANGQSLFLLFGLGGQDLSITGPLKQWFDLIVFIRESTPSHPIA